MNTSIALSTTAALLAGILLSSGNMPAEAKNCHRRSVNHRQAHQTRRIDQGIASGSLTRREARGLERMENRFARKEARLRASGGGLSASEKRDLQTDMNQMSGIIYHEKHDAQTR